MFIQEIIYLKNKGLGKCDKSWWGKIYSNSLDSFVVNGNKRRASYDAIYFNSFGVENISKELKKLMGNKNIITNDIEYKHTIR